MIDVKMYATIDIIMILYFTSFIRGVLVDRTGGHYGETHTLIVEEI